MKSIPSSNYTVQQFLTHKQQSYSYTFLSASNPVQITVDIAQIPPTTTSYSSSAFLFTSQSALINSSSGIYQIPLYAGIQNLLYFSGSIYSRPYIYIPVENQFYVVNVAQQAYGEEIDPGTIVLSSADSTASLMDDGFGNIVSSAVTSSVLGSVNYSLGLIVLKQFTGSFSGSTVTDVGCYFNTGSHLTIDFDASHTIYEHQVVCTMDAGDFNYSSNPSVSTGSSAVTGSGAIIDQFASQSLTPYMTTIGCYTNRGELVAVAKFPRPVKRAPDTQQTVILRFDV